MDFKFELFIIIFLIILIISIGVVALVYLEITTNNKYYDDALDEIQREEEINNELNSK